MNNIRRLEAASGKETSDQFQIQHEHLAPIFARMFYSL